MYLFFRHSGTHCAMLSELRGPVIRPKLLQEFVHPELLQALALPLCAEVHIEALDVVDDVHEAGREAKLGEEVRKVVWDAPS
jgi:hypothetical protein